MLKSLNPRVMQGLALGFAALWGSVSANPVQAPHIEAELVTESRVLAPGVNWVALRLRPERGWHTYWINPGDSGLPTALQWTLPEGVAAGPIHWPYPGTHRLGGLVNYGYDEETLHLVPLTVPASAVGATLPLEVKADWLVCEEICIPGQATLRVERPVSAAAEPDPRQRQAFADARARLPQPGPLDGRFEVADQELRFAITPPADVTVSRAQFFPYAPDLVDHAAAQAVEVTDEGVRIAQARSALYQSAPAEVTGVLVMPGRPGRAWEVRMQPGAVSPVTAAAPAEPALQPGLVLVLGFAFLGGLILNLMPCVFPVLSIKAVSLLEAQGEGRHRQKVHALAYTAGVVACCVLAAAIIFALRAGGETLGWGFQLQSPMFVAALAYVLFALGLSMSGLVQFGTTLMGVGQSLTVRGGYTGSFFTGVLAVVVASPCTAPFMGTALGYALTQPALPALATFIALGLGLAVPFLLLGFVPRLAALLPRPGPWMETFKQFMAFPLYLTVVWLLWVLGRQTGMDAVALVLVGLVLIGFACWLQPLGRWPQRVLRLAAALAALALITHSSLDVPAADAKPPVAADAVWQPYSDARLAALRTGGRPVFVNLTADWCISCKVNERVALDVDRVLDAFAARNVALLKGDWTRADPAITRVLERFNRPGVPLYLLYAPSGEPQVLPQILTPDIVIEAVRQLP